MDSRPLPRTKPRAFSLVEAAMVLAIVGAVIGGIWVAAASFYENYKVNKTVEGVFTIAKNIQKMISSRDAASMAIGESDLTSFSINAGLIPRDWIKGGVIESYFNETVTVWNAYNPPDDVRFNVTLSGKISSAVCGKIIIRLSSFSALAGGNGTLMGTGKGQNIGQLVRVYVNSGIMSNFPISHAQAVSACSGNITSVRVVFSYSRIN